MNIRYVENSAIEKEKYTECIRRCPFYIIYAEFEYLNEISNRQWGALILDDYKAVMPLPWRKKWGLYYVYMPLFCQQLGVFGNVGNLKIQDFMIAIPFKFIRIHLNVHQGFGIPKFSKNKPNFVLKAPIHPEQSFNKDAWKNIYKSINAGVTFKWDEKIETVLKLYHQAWGYKNGFTWIKDYKSFEAACHQLELTNNLLVISAHLENDLLGAAIFLKSENTMHYVCAAPSESGKSLGIMHGIIHAVAVKYPEHNIDFEGSSIPSVAQFYKKFGPVTIPYSSIHRTLWWNI